MIFQRLEEELKGLDLSNTYRDWGQSIVLSKTFDKDGVVIHRQKLLILKPNALITLEKHLDYAELWMGDSEFEYVLEDYVGNLNKGVASPYERVFIPRDRKHKIISGDTGLRIYEVQMGVIDENDKIKFE